MGTLVTAEKKDIFQEEVDFKSGIAERTWFKIAGAINFINERHYHRHDWNLNGVLTNSVGQAIDGFFVFPIDVEVAAITMTLGKGGSSGNLTSDLHWYDDSDSDQGTIFSTKPDMASTAGDSVILGRNFLTAVDSGGTGITLPVLSKTEFDAFDALRWDLDAVQPGSRDVNLSIFYRPR